MKDDILNTEELTLKLIEYLQEEYPGAIAGRYGISEEDSPVSVLERIAGVRGCIRKGDDPDYARAAVLFLDDFRSGRLGRITLEKPE